MSKFTDLEAGRTKLAVEHNGHIALNPDGKVYFVKKYPGYEVVDRYTRNFNRPLCSAGASSDRELLVLNPRSETLLKQYEKLKTKIKKNKKNTLENLKLIGKFTKELLENSDDDFEYNGNDQVKALTLGDCINQKKGVCRHHTLLNCYFISKLIEDNLIDGEVIHHRQNIIRDGKRGAHTWVIFKENDKLYSLDSLNDQILCIDDEPKTLDESWGRGTVTEIKKRYIDTPKDNIEKFCNHLGKVINKIKNKKYESKEDVDEIFNKIILEIKHDNFFHPEGGWRLNESQKNQIERFLDLIFRTPKRQ